MELLFRYYPNDLSNYQSQKDETSQNNKLYFFLPLKYQQYKNIHKIISKIISYMLHIELEVISLQIHQFLMRARFDDSALLDNDDFVGIFNGR